jgi:hypothetical protein
MKRINFSKTVLFAVMIGLFSTISVYAEGPVVKSANNIRAKFVQAVMNPEDVTTLPTTGQVEVLFSLTDDGMVKIKKIKSNDDNAATYVKQKLNTVECKDFIHPYNQYYKIKFNFNPDVD